jgi:hypothetical protein
MVDKKHVGNVASTRAIAVVTKDDAGNTLKRYFSITQAAKEVGCRGTHIIDAIKFGNKCKGYTWEYDTYQTNDALEKSKKRKLERAETTSSDVPTLTLGIAVVKKDAQGNVLKRYDSIAQAAKGENCSKFGIRTGLQKGRFKGEIWDYDTRQTNGALERSKKRKLEKAQSSDEREPKRSKTGS